MKIRKRREKRGRKPMKKAYLAGDLLQKGNAILRGIERDQINELGTVKLFNPGDSKEINDKSKAPTAEMIFAKDTAAMLESDIIIMDISNTSIGTVSEAGQMWGVNFMLNKIEGVLSDAESPEEIEEGIRALLKEIPKKKVMWHTTDIRDTNLYEQGIRRSHSYNQYVVGMMHSVSGPVRTFEEILEELKDEA